MINLTDRINSYIADSVDTIAEMVLEGHENIALYVWYAPETEEFDEEIEFTFKAWENFEGMELVEVVEYLEDNDEVCEIVEDAREYARDPYAYNGVSRRDFY